MDPQKIYTEVQTRYGHLADEISATRQSTNEKIANAFGYSASDLESIPLDANLGVSCGNPVAVAKLREGETVVDLGSGGGLDVLLAARKVGVKGKAIGVDMTRSMINLARKNAAKANLRNTHFIESPITSIPLPDSSTDCIISNCVINLVPSAEKHLVFAEMFRILKPGGRVAVSDILARRELPWDLVENMALYMGCIAGARRVCEYEEFLKGVGFQDILIVDTEKDLNAYKDLVQSQAQTGCCSQSNSKSNENENEQKSETRPAEINFNDWAGSFQIYAIKP
ncbi:Arsenite methyltransferase [Penicillium argentinense]|uniref:Arsenite methyltransferase n=1 Tax=Penicillium argentinense TaxID=1131581 RepID=A0A9W9EPC8_9EURO|nr:Arsenite methyltransferase [Penicillium argentinense]KAJ5085553.1 Arsenite methyltransferase [Penicillium argentinense]